MMMIRIVMLMTWLIPLSKVEGNSVGNEQTALELI